jgi:hypothetical protein
MIAATPTQTDHDRRLAAIAVNVVRAELSHSITNDAAVTTTTTDMRDRFRDLLRVALSDDTMSTSEIADMLAEAVTGWPSTA